MISDWKHSTLGEILVLNYGKGLPESNRLPGNIPVYGSNGIVGWHNKPLINKYGLIVGRKGSAGNVHLSSTPFFPIDTTFYVTEDDTELDIKFLYFLLLHTDLKRILGDVGVPGLNREMAYKEEVVFPHGKVEQQKIAYILSTVQKAIELQDSIIKTTTELKKALMQKLFTEGLNGEPQKETEIGLIPESWMVETIGDIANVMSGGTPNREVKEYWENGNIPWVKTGEINYTYIAETEEYITNDGLINSSAKIFPSGTLLIAMYGQGITRGRVAMLSISAATNQACAAIIPRNNEHLITRYLYYYLEYRYDSIRDLAHGANQKNLSATIIKSFVMPVPTNITEQNRISEILDLVDQKLTIVKCKTNRLRELFNTLLHQLMTAQIRVNDIDFDEIESLVSQKEL